MSYNELSAAFDSLKAPVANLSSLYQQSSDQISAAASVDKKGVVTIDANALQAAIDDIVPPGATGQYQLLTNGLDMGFIVDKNRLVAPWSALTTPELVAQLDPHMWSFLGFGQQPALVPGAFGQRLLMRPLAKPFGSLKQAVPDVVTSAENMAMLATAAVQASAQPTGSGPRGLDGSIWMLNPDNAATLLVKAPPAAPDPGSNLGTTSSGQALSIDDFKDLPSCIAKSQAGFENPFMMRICFDKSCGDSLVKALNAIINRIVQNPEAVIGALFTTGFAAALGAIGGWVALCIALSAAYWALMIWANTTANGVCLHIPMPWTFGVIGPGWATGR